MEQTNIQPPLTGLTPETEKLLNKWLKIQIAQHNWGIVFKVLAFIFVICSLIFSAFTLGPFLQSQMGLLRNVQSTLDSFANGTYGTKNQNTTSPSSDDIIKN